MYGRKGRKKKKEWERERKKSISVGGEIRPDLKLFGSNPHTEFYFST